MDENGYRAFLKDRNLDDEKITDSVAAVRRHEEYLEDNDKSLTSADRQDFRAYVSILMEKRNNSYEEFYALARYAYFIGNLETYLGILELTDGADVMEVLSDALADEIGDSWREQIFEDITLPPLGTPSGEKNKVAQIVIQRIERLLDQETCEEILSKVAHGIPREYYEKERQKYLDAGSLQEYVKRKRADAIENLVKHREEGTLFYTQEITDEVLDFVSSRPDILTGELREDVIYHTKIPYMTKEYLAETDERMKRFYYCHCPWARESILDDDIDVSSTLCYCSAGFTKQPWEVALDQPLEIRLVKSVLKGDLECSFEIQLPKDI
ncbi:hypothetical protein EU538_00980 [Candidatus Thorarchaeota archaeon]|nr:MAG: hypothetical protein EU538_00980 [Candidatus Thorarchaeota archaeon]